MFPPHNLKTLRTEGSDTFCFDKRIPAIKTEYTKSLCRDRVVKAPIEDAWVKPASDLKLNEIFSVMASRLAYLVVEGWAIERLANDTLLSFKR